MGSISDHRALRTGLSVRQKEVHIERPDGVRAEAREQLLARELDHRAKNLLAVVQAAVHLTQADTVEDFRAAVQGRLHALAKAHSMLAKSHWFGADLKSIVTDELAPFQTDDAPRADISGSNFTLNPQAAQTLALVLHELTTNAVKYGALSIHSGRLKIEWSRIDGDLVFRWSESGGPIVNAPTRQGFGARLVGPVVQTDLGGKYQCSWPPSGFACEMVIPIDHVVAKLNPA
jgi:two-component sensor histidine kinase